MQPVGIENIKVGGEIGRRIGITARNNILELDLEKDFISPFRGEWDFRTQGDFIGLGKLLDAVTRLAAYLKDEQMTALRRYLIDEIMSLQGEDGYIGLMKPKDRMGNLWDIHEIAFLLIGLVSDYIYWKEDRSLKVAVRLADFMMEAWKKNPDNISSFIDGSTLGAENAYVYLYEITKDQRYLDFLDRYLKPRDWNKEIIIGRYGRIGGHIYNYLGKTLAHMEALRIAGEDCLSDTVKRMLDFIFRKDGMVISGEMGDYECWTDNQEGTDGLGETCATAYFLFVLDALIKCTGNPFYGDVMERTIYNGLFAAQSPEGRELRYYTSFEGARGYFNVDNYCCPGNYRRAISCLPEMVYYTDDRGIAVNLYTDSSVQAKLGSGLQVALRQETDYPRSGQISITLEPAQAAQFALKLRIPGWCENAAVKVNDETITLGAPKGKFLEIVRSWNPGDRVEMVLSMPFRFIKGRKKQAGKTAVMRGPVIFCLNRLKNPGLEESYLRSIVLDTATLKGPFNDDTVHAGGQAYEIEAWAPKKDHFHKQALVHFPQTAPNMKLWLTEYADPGCEAIYFKAPNPRAREFKDDELIRGEE